MTNFLTDLSEAALITATEANLFEMLPALYGRLPNAVCRTEADATWYITDIPFPLFNGVIHARFTPDRSAARISEIVAPFKTEGKPMVWWTGPSTQPENLGTHLQAHGLLPMESMPGMAVDLNAMNESLPANPAVTVRRVSNLDDLKQWIGPFATNFEFPKKTVPQLYETIAQLGFDEQGALHHYLGMLNSEVVGTSSVYLGAGVAGIYNVSTLPKGRRQGLGTALTLAPLRMARERGYRVGVLHSSEMGYKVYQRIGFRNLCTIRLYLYLPNRVQRGFLKLYLGAEHFVKALRPPTR